MYLTPNETSYINSAAAGAELFKKKAQEQREKELLINNSNKQIELMQGQVDILKQQLEEVKEEKKKINELYELKNKELEDSTKELKKSKIYNTVMLGIAIASLVATILIGVFL